MYINTSLHPDVVSIHSSIFYLETMKVTLMALLFALAFAESKSSGSFGYVILHHIYVLYIFQKIICVYLFLCAENRILQDFNSAQMMGNLESKVSNSARTNFHPIDLIENALAIEKDAESSRRCARTGRKFYGKYALKKCEKVCCQKCWFLKEHPTLYSCGKK